MKSLLSLPLFVAMLSACVVVPQESYSSHTTHQVGPAMTGYYWGGPAEAYPVGKRSGYAAPAPVYVSPAPVYIAPASAHAPAVQFTHGTRLAPPVPHIRLQEDGRPRHGQRQRNSAQAWDQHKPRLKDGLQGQFPRW
jgi:hypothetical protein